MANPLTSLRKLGIKLVGDNGILDTVVASQYGFGPLAKQKLIDDAKKTALTEATTMQNLEKGNLDMEGKRVDIAGNRQTNDQNAQLFPSKLTQEQNQATKGGMEIEEGKREIELRNQTKTQLAKMLGVDEDKAEGLLSALTGINKSGNMLVNKDMSKEYDIPEGLVDDRVVNLRAQDKQAERARNAQAAIENRRISADAARTKTLEDKAFEEATNEAHRIKSSKPYQENLTTINKIQQMNDGLRELQAGNVLKGSVTPVLIMAFNKVLDPISVVRSEEYARTAEEQSMIRRVQGYAGSITQGSKIDQGTLEEIVYVANLIAKRSKEKQQEMFSNFKDAMKMRPLTSMLPDAYLERVMNIGENKPNNGSALSPAAQRAKDKAGN